MTTWNIKPGIIGVGCYSGFGGFTWAWSYRLTRTAEEQIAALLLDSARDHGLETAGRYGQLILAVLAVLAVPAALGEEPDMIGSVEVLRLGGVRAYPTRLGRRRVEPARRVAAPRHPVVYRLARIMSSRSWAWCMTAWCFPAQLGK